MQGSLNHARIWTIAATIHADGAELRKRPEGVAHEQVHSHASPPRTPQTHTVMLLGHDIYHSGGSKLHVGVMEPR